MEDLKSLTEVIAKVTEVAAIIIILVSMIYSAIRFGQNSRDVGTNDSSRANSLTISFARVGRGLLAGLEILVAAGIIRTIALEPTLQRVIAPGVLVRVILGWSITVEIEGRWPWQARKEPPAKAEK